MTAARKPSEREVWQILEGVADPEIPVLSLVDLGMIRDVQYAGGRLQVTVSPTYVGCPATDVIKDDIRVALEAAGLGPFDILTALAPPWTTDWITPQGHEKLHAYGIAPPVRNAAQTCPRCGSRETEIVSAFGSTPCKGLARCTRCAEPFEFFKCSAA